MTFEQRLWRRVGRGGENDCWPVTTGRAVIMLDGKNRKMSHFVCQWFHGDPPSQSCIVLHSCDNTVCLNWRHLSWGTHAMNMREASDRGRLITKRPIRRRLTAEDVKLIRELLAGGTSGRSIAAHFDISDRMVRKIKNREAWAQV